MKRVRLIKMFFAALLIVATSGCMWSRVRTNEADAGNLILRSYKVQPGQTRNEELLRIMGMPPNTITPMRDGRQLYAYHVADSKTKGFSIILVSFSRTNSRTDSVFFLINQAGIVEAAFRGKPEQLPWEWWPFDN
jgi:hypothetical protein